MAKTDNKHTDILDFARERGLATPQAGMSVPEGYFEAFAERMAAALPYRPEAEEQSRQQVPKRTTWQNIRPYIYLAAMFAGVWLMMQMFTMMGGRGHLEPMESNTVLAEAVNNDDFFFDYYLDDISSYDAYSYYGPEGDLADEGDADAMTQSAADSTGAAIQPEP